MGLVAPAAEAEPKPSVPSDLKAEAKSDSKPNSAQ